MSPQKLYERAFMLETLDPFDFVLAEALGMTVEEMNNRMSNQEYLQWRAYYIYKDAMRKMHEP